MVKDSWQDVGPVVRPVTGESGGSQEGRALGL